MCYSAALWTVYIFSAMPTMEVHGGSVVEYGLPMWSSYFSICRWLLKQPHSERAVTMKTAMEGAQRIHKLVEWNANALLRAHLIRATMNQIQDDAVTLHEEEVSFETRADLMKAVQEELHKRRVQEVHVLAAKHGERARKAAATRKANKEMQQEQERLEREERLAAKAQKIQTKGEGCHQQQQDHHQPGCHHQVHDKKAKKDKKAKQDKQDKKAQKDNNNTEKTTKGGKDKSAKNDKKAQKDTKDKKAKQRQEGKKGKG